MACQLVVCARMSLMTDIARQPDEVTIDERKQETGERESKRGRDDYMQKMSRMPQQARVSEREGGKLRSLTAR